MGETQVGERGEYEITYTREAFARSEHASADLVVRVYGERDELLGASRTLFNAPPRATIDLVLDSPNGRLSEYERNLATVTPLLDGAQLAELTDADVRFLAGDTGIEAAQLRTLSDATAFGAEHELPVEAGYGWGRLDYPLVLDELLGYPVGELRAALVRAIGRTIIPAGIEDQLDAIEARLLELGVRLDEPDPDTETTPVVGRLVTERDGTPLAGFTVHGMDPAARVQPADLGTDATDHRGYFGLATIPWPDPDQQSRIVHLEIDDPDGERVLATEVQVGREPTVHEIRVPVEPPSDEPPAPHVAEIVQRFGIDVPAGLLDRLRERGLHTLTDLRRAGGLANIEDLDVDLDDQGVRALEGHTSLAAISPDPEHNAGLIERGFAGVRQIATTTRARFVTAAGDINGDMWAARTYVAAASHAKMVDNVLAGALAEVVIKGDSDKVPYKIPQLLLGHFAGTGCHCDDCQAATSPLAYLADLLNYAKEHLEHLGGGQTTLTLLTSVFHQPFGKLPTACEEMDRKVRQVRLCVEVLRGYLKAHPSAHPIKKALLAKRIRDYLVDAYAALLTGIGTSYEEIRLARTAKREDRAALADRLGIDLAGARPDELDQLLLDVNASPSELTEQALQQRFGLVDTTVAQPAPEPDAEFRDWRLSHLRTVWQAQDRPPDRFDTHPSPAFPATELRPVIDPDLVGPDDLRHPGPGAAPFDLWLKRRDWTDDRLTATRALLGDPADLTQAFAAMYQLVSYNAQQGPVTETPWAANTQPDEFAALDEQLRDGENVEEITERLATDLRLGVEAFGRLVTVWALLDNGEPAAPEDLSAVVDILVQAQKDAFNQPWRTEEHALDVLLEPAEFWVSLTEPQLGTWPPEFPAGTPLIDPERDKLTDLPDIAATGRGAELWQERVERLAEITEALRAERKAGDYPGMLLLALGSPGQTADQLLAVLLALQGDLASTDPATVAAATETIQTDFGLSIEDFQFLLAVHARTQSSDPDAQPTAEEWARVETALTSAQKQRKEYPVWVTAEQHATTGVTYWQARKAALPEWRPGAAGRAQWQQALATRSEPPIIDPDLIGPKDLEHPASGLVYQTWKSRHDTVNDWIAELEAEGETLAALQSIVLSTLGVPLDDLSTLDESHAAGEDVVPRLDQFPLPFPAFRRLIGVANLLTAQAPVLADEWEEVRSILVQARKRRLATRWREDERTLGLALGPDEFHLPEIDPTVFPPPEPDELPAWRATTQARNSWRDTLLSRIEHEQTTVTALADMVSAVEEQTLPALRDALMGAIDAPPGYPGEKATWLTKRLLIDTKAGGCQLTTRIAQAIETIQGVLFAARIGELSEVYPDLELDADHFDTEWETLGSYATWRGAMLVHLYPELVLAPSLRPRATPAFLDLVKDTRDGHFTPERACAAARAYSDYLKDVATLDVQVSCEASTRMTKGGACAKTDAGYPDLLHMYAIAKDSRQAYWSTYDPPPPIVMSDPDAGYRQSFWDTIPGLEQCDRLIGSAPYKIPDSNERHIYLFAITHEKGVRKLVFTRFDLEGGFWDEEPTELELPEGATQFGAVVMQTYYDTAAPLVAIRVPSGAIYWRRLDVSGSGWREGDWQVVVGSSKGKDFAEVLALVQRPAVGGFPTRFLFVRTNTDQIHFRVVDKLTDGVWHTHGLAGFRGLLHAENFGFAYTYAAGASTRYMDVVALPDQDGEWATLGELEQWLVDNLGMSLRQIPVPAMGYISATTLLDLLATTFDDPLLQHFQHLLRGFLPDSTADDLTTLYLVAMKMDALLTLYSKIKDADSNEDGEYGPWKHAFDIIGQATMGSSQLTRALWRLVIVGQSVTFRRWDMSRTAGGALPAVGRLAAASRDSTDSIGINAWRQRVYQGVGGYHGPRRRAIRYKDGGYQVHGDFWRTAPLLSGPFEIPNHLSSADLQARREAIEDAWVPNAAPGSPRSNLTYLEEAYYFIPVHLAAQLTGEHVAALDWLRTVYDYAAPQDDRKIYHGLRTESEIDTEGQYDRRADWLLDPLNPHAIAGTRKDAYTRYTILTIVNLLLDFADSEFTIDTPESVPRARGLYQLALDLLASPELARTVPGCAEVIGSLEIEINDPHWTWVVTVFKKGMSEITGQAVLADTIAKVQQAVGAEASWDVRFTNAQQIIAAAKTPPAAVTVGAVLDKRTQLADRLHAATLSWTAVDAAARRVASSAGRQLVNTVSFISGVTAQTLVDEPVSLPWLRERASVAPAPTDTRRWPAARIPRGAGTTRLRRPSSASWSRRPWRGR
ncbi:MAG: hypothetical protein GEV28_04845 [Actinophytocola sp.]|uniref:neuraminidase-like domain-containing protein n=1 Tax=Actinophytocola sp. TaxID=1872138 RepID=UPI00132C5FE3|nr:neuraminidase-like domain-containing protein [Actinophytocola sp.]MPZ79747.1 hypothetical protein [Actinophytocola sp.]